MSNKKNILTGSPSPAGIPLTCLSGVGPRRAEALRAVGLESAEDLLSYFPRAYLDRRRISPISSLVPGMFAVVQGRVFSASLGWGRRGRRPFRIMVEDDTGRVRCTWFNQPYLARRLCQGDEIVLCGKVTERGGLGMVNPDLEQDPSRAPEGLVPVYPAVEGLSQKLLRRAVSGALDLIDSAEPFPPGLIARWGVPGKKEALREIHFPPDYPALESARRRLVLEEFLILQLGLLRRRARGRLARRAPILHGKGRDRLKEFLQALSFKLTAAQDRAIAEITRDLEGPAPMRRLLMGEVGSGKTLVALSAAVMALGEGWQVAVMAPTEVLARQLYETMGREIARQGGKVVFLGGGSGSMGAARALEAGEADLAVGTQALLGSKVKFSRLGLVVIDEQHRFGVRQKAALAARGCAPHVLVMTATPIPRTLSYTVYGDLDFSVIDELPPGRPGIRTLWIGPEKLPGAYEFIRSEVEKGRQGYVVFPLIGSSGDDKSATGRLPVLRDRFFRGLRVEILHGGLDSEKKGRVMRDFAAGRIDVLVATSVIELGVDVTNASVILIEGAERFGLAQLHQLRGRVGRGAHPSFCILQGNPATPAARRRLAAVRRIDDGFVLARQDLEIRGPGQFYGVRQHGLPELRLGDLLGDIGLLEKARQEAHRILSRDPDLNQPAHGRLCERLGRWAGVDGGI